mmetsp:Transcript_8669/g.28584  ORF Transcript_8669/g.28584 Transcript_8669/m.28584 type:complete len:227 (+) Transcript_8669:86-766(+)|eukprot:CAMPEP_0170143614 /NCGR_PEP_ID=MMETSP0033_2-20121228/11984_1 /TAXON_ID=195969 /ORGANISM="Dolichomastix tenuilepis, Strain CCMP3274" /LENGTH=226 /DNA_ID=CAMNT_0010380073 /DNA_START=93 /DNA_END=773 /DNA_ORIENTATION=+
MARASVLVAVMAVLVSSVGGVRVLPSSSSSSGGLGIRAEPVFCHDIECPHFEVVHKTDAYEVRSYDATVWATTLLKDVDWDKAEKSGFMRLFNYISGENEQAIKIPMTAPVRNQVAPGAGPFCASSFNISFYVPAAFQQSPPAPTDATISIRREAAYTYYVAQGKGFWKEDDTEKAAAKLAEALTADGLTFDNSTWFFAGYDPPFRLIDRHNEVWFRAPSSVATQT